MGKFTLKQLVEQEKATAIQAERYRDMAQALRKLEPTFTESLVNEEVARFVRLAKELDDSADTIAHEIAERFGHRDVARAYDAAGFTR